MMNADFGEFLTPKQQLFCDEYLTDMNATRAALRAGYSGSTALNGQLMNMPKIKLHLQQRMGANAAKAQFTHDMVLRELGKIAFGNMGDYFDADGCIKPMHDVSEDAKAALWSISVTDAGSGRAAGDNTNNGRPDSGRSKGGIVEITKFRMYNKLSALDKIAKHIGFYNATGVQPETIYTCLTHEQLTADDSFDDAVLQEEMMQIKKAKLKMQKAEMAKARREMLRMERERCLPIKGEDDELDVEPDGFGGAVVDLPAVEQDVVKATVAVISPLAPLPRRGPRIVSPTTYAGMGMRRFR